MCDSTTIYESIGDTHAHSLIHRLFGKLDECVQANGGTVVKTLGDGMVCRFGEADAAFRAACDMQSAAVAAEAGEDTKLTIKVGFTWGPVVTASGDVFGDTVNVCARLSGLGSPHQVLTTQEAIDALSPELRSRSRPLYPIKVRGRVGEVKVCEVLWRLDPDMTEALDPAPVASRDWVLKLTYGGDTIEIDASSSVRLGRDKTNDVVVPSTLASRVHARVYCRGGNFVIADQSSNGTYVITDGNSREVTLRREEALLGERGYIGLGGPASKAGDHVLRYRLETRKP